MDRLKRSTASAQETWPGAEAAEVLSDAGARGMVGWGDASERLEEVLRLAPLEDVRLELGEVVGDEEGEQHLWLGLGLGLGLVR